MSAIDKLIDQVHRVHGKLGTAEFARVAGVPYTTLRDLKSKGFGKPVDTLRKLASAAEEAEGRAA